MNNTSLSRTLAGSGIILVGVAALLGGLNIINFGHLLATYWPTIVIAGGLLILLANPREQYMWAILFIALGLMWQLRAIGVVDFNVWALFWPLVLMTLGWSVITNRAWGTDKIVNRDADNASAILGGVETKIDSNNYTGSKISVILGGSVLDLRHANIKKEATIEVFALMGGMEVKVPEGWTVRSSVMPILGGVENRTISSTNKNAPVLNIIGTTILGGVEVKH